MEGLILLGLAGVGYVMNKDKDSHRVDTKVRPPVFQNSNASIYDLNNVIELKNLEDSFASAANYVNKIGWKKNEPCFVKVELVNNIPTKLLNTSAKKIKQKKKMKYLKKYIIDFEDKNINKTR